MFPTLKVRVHGLDPHKNYLLALEIVPFDDKRYRYVYHSSQWMIAGAGDPPPPSASGGATVNTFLHGDSPSSGEFWQSQSLISFDKLKLTNNRVSLFLKMKLTERKVLMVWNFVCDLILEINSLRLSGLNLLPRSACPPAELSLPYSKLFQPPFYIFFSAIPSQILVR